MQHDGDCTQFMCSPPGHICQNRTKKMAWVQRRLRNMELTISNIIKLQIAFTVTTSLVELHGSSI